VRTDSGWGEVATLIDADVGGDARLVALVGGATTWAWRASDIQIYVQTVGQQGTGSDQMRRWSALLDWSTISRHGLGDGLHTRLLT